MTSNKGKSLAELQQEAAKELLALHAEKKRLEDLERVLIAQHTKQINDIETQMARIDARKQYIQDLWNSREMTKSEWLSILQKDTPYETNRRIRRARQRINVAKSKWEGR